MHSLLPWLFSTHSSFFTLKLTAIGNAHVSHAAEEPDFCIPAPSSISRHQTYYTPIYSSLPYESITYLSNFSNIHSNKKQRIQDMTHFSKFNRKNTFHKSAPVAMLVLPKTEVKIYH
jgi:hypothetical protein